MLCWSTNKHFFSKKQTELKFNQQFFLDVATDALKHKRIQIKFFHRSRRTREYKGNGLCHEKLLRIIMSFFLFFAPFVFWIKMHFFLLIFPSFFPFICDIYSFQFIQRQTDNDIVILFCCFDKSWIFNSPHRNGFKLHQKNISSLITMMKKHIILSTLQTTRKP